MSVEKIFRKIFPVSFGGGNGTNIETRKSQFYLATNSYYSRLL